jgi:hypothetical protein
LYDTAHDVWIEEEEEVEMTTRVAPDVVRGAWTR